VSAVVLGDKLDGPAGTAQEVTATKLRRPDEAATVAAWFLHCPGQSAAWDRYMLYVIHLRPIPGVKPAVVHVPHATHEVVLVALDPERNPVPAKPKTWSFLHPLNVVDQVTVPSDDAAQSLARDCAQAVVDGRLPAEPPLSGAVEPWRSALIKTSAHLRGEGHAP
jgi:hypothetical protein